MRNVLVAAVVAALCFACNGADQSYLEVPPTPRRAAVWVDENGLDAATSERMRAAGVDEIVVRIGGLNLAGQAPVLRFTPTAHVEGGIPVGIVLEVEGARPGLGETAAEAVWRALDNELRGKTPAEIILDTPRLSEGFDQFAESLTEVSGVSVVPLLSFEQLQEEDGLRLASVARTVVIPAFGSDGADLRGIGDLDPLPLSEKLEPLVGVDVKVRLAVVLSPRTDPAIEGPGDDLDPLTEVATVSTASILDRTFTFDRALTWSGRSWKPGDTLALRWVDAAKLQAALKEIHRLAMPEVAGWDLVSLPPEERSLGLGRDTLLRYLEGEGPEPSIEIRAERDGRNLRVFLANTGPFVTAVTNHGNWVQVSVEDGWIQARDSGSFDGLRLGNSVNGEWRESDLDRFNAVRFTEVYLGPGEHLDSGSVRLPSTRTRALIGWHLTLSDGSSVSGRLVR